MNLVEEFTLLAYDDDGTPLTDGTHLDHGLGGGLLLELALAGRVDVADKKVVALDTSPTGDPLVDAALMRIVADDKPRKPGHWVSKFAKDTRFQVLDKLVADGILRVEKDKVLWVFPRTKYPAAHGVEPVQETAARDRMRHAVLGTGAAEPRTGALCALVAATDLEKSVFGDLDQKVVKTRLREISEGAWAAEAVKKAIEEIQAAVMVAIVASTTAATAGTPS
ncbi:GPP34 family phosphoprotein [Actinoplanes sp. LDG1-06]|uniref:GPP34 family phosphoprotein n=1 Tax=Paractinoplanes ovalisporus TaxID=2810368 RepID=A0ABS2AAE7_9ACTN|nr:GPP34 family phosphoprotein [Actinoplanes ovalisporus]MBM2616810.1 GPP34 family phosphoprotein [Actinoplanes ovalisporus]